MSSSIVLTTARLTLTPPALDDAESMLDYHQRNRLNLEPWVPRRDERFYALESAQARIRAMSGRVREGTALPLLLRLPDSQKIVGEIEFSNIVRGPFQACYLGFSLCHKFEGQRLMYEALQCAIEFVFTSLELHRVMANYRPENQRSQKLLQRLGFEVEGRARSYLKIDGQWRDHVLTSLTNENSC